MTDVRPVPAGFHTVTPYLVVAGVAPLLDFLERAFGAEVIERFARPDGSIAHAQLRIGDSMLEASDARPEWPPRPATLHLYLPDCDAAYARAMAAGAKSLFAPDTKFYGDREAGVEDPAGNQWFLATRVEEVSPEELAKRAAESTTP